MLKWAILLSVFLFGSLLHADNLITLDQAIELSLKRSPVRHASHSFVHEMKGSYWQSKLYPNPEFVFDAENIGGKGSNLSFDTPQLTYSIFQLIEIGGKRFARRQEA